MSESSKKRKRSENFKKDGMTNYERMGKKCQMQSKRQPDPRGYQNEKGTDPPEMTETQRVFKQASQFTPFFFQHYTGVTGWHIFTEEMSCTFMDYFRKKNYPVLDGENGVSYYPDFYFSVGWLVPPRDIRATREGWVITLTWEITSREYKLSCPTDQLLVGYFYDSRPDSPWVITTLTATRRERKALFTIPDRELPDGELLHIYPFFRREDGTDYSESRHTCC